MSMAGEYRYRLEATGHAGTFSLTQCRKIMPALRHINNSIHIQAMYPAKSNASLLLIMAIIFWPNPLYKVLL